VIFVEYLHAEISFDRKRAIETIEQIIIKTPSSEFSRHIRLAAERAFDAILSPRMVLEFRAHITDEAERNCIKSFTSTLHSLFMQPPCVGRVVLGIDPGFKDGTTNVLCSKTDMI